jgi:nitronate monooxygenase
MARVANNDTAKECLKLESKGVTLQELISTISGKRGKMAMDKGDLNGGIFVVGQALGLIDDVLSVDELFTRLVSEMNESKNRLNDIY